MIKSILIAVCCLTMGTLFPNDSQAQKLDKSILWEVSGNGLKQPSYLFGTIHIICNDNYVHFSKIDSVYHLVTTVAVELDITDPSIQMEIATGLMSNEDKKISELFEEKDAAALDQYLANQFNTNLAMFDMFHPAMLLTLLSQSSVLCDSVRSYDLEMIQKVKADQKNLVNLETATIQINALKSIPTADIIVAVKDIIYAKNNKSKVSQTNQKLVNAYKQEDLRQLSKLIDKKSNNMQQVTADLLDNRNRSWIPKIEELMQKEPTLITFGAAHYTGTTGIINLLREKGYTVKPIKK